MRRTPSRLGFGCSALVSGRTRREAVRLLEVALDAGITHFDLARAYGTGDAEAYVGDFAPQHRDRITLTTKFGIDPVAANRATAGAKRLIRLATRRSRRVLRLVRRHGSSTVKRGLFSPEQARASLELSLSRLNVDHVDAYLLHDCARSDWEQGDLQATLEALRNDGSVGSYGPSATYSEVRSILAGSVPRLAVAQFEADAFRPNALEGDASPLTITHGCFRHALPRLREAVAGEPATAAAWSRSLGVDASSVAELSGLLLAAALRANPEGIVLFSSGDSARIQRNARIASEQPYEAAQLAEFERLVRELGPLGRRGL